MEATPQGERKMNEIQVFKNENLKLSIRAIKNNDGSISVNIEDVARGLGFTRLAGSGNEVIRWDRINAYLESFGHAQKVGMGDFIPETLFYLLGMKGTNEKAKDFQVWIAKDVLPSIRKTGSYSVNEDTSENTQLRLKTQYLKELNRLIDNFNGDTNAVLSVLNKEVLNPPIVSQLSPEGRNEIIVKPLCDADFKPGQNKYKTIDDFVKTHKVESGTLANDFYLDYIEYCNVIGQLPRTYNAFIKRIKDVTRLKTAPVRGQGLSVLTEK